MRLIQILLLLLLSSYTFSQSEVVDTNFVLSDFQKSKLTEAVDMYNQKMYRASLQSSKAGMQFGEKIQLLDLCGNAFYSLAEYDSAAKYYKKALDKLTQKEELNYEINIRAKYGWALSINGEDSSAILQLKRSCLHPYSLTDPHNYWKLAQYFEKVNQKKAALFEYIKVILLDPSSKEAWNEIEKYGDIDYNVFKSQNTNLFNYLSKKQFSYFIEIILPLGNPDNWQTKFKKMPTTDVEFALNLYYHFGVDLDSSLSNSSHDIIPSYRYCTSKIIMWLQMYNFIRGEQSGNKDYFGQSLFYSSFFSTIDTIQNKSLDFQSEFSRVVMKSYYHLNDLYHSIDKWSELLRIDSVANTPDSIIMEDKKFAQFILQKALTNISFDLETNELRDWDFDDFTGPIISNKENLKSDSNAAGKFNKNIPLNKYPKLINCNCYPYGIVSSDEDGVNTHTEMSEINRVMMAFAKKTHKDSMSVVEGLVFLGDKKENEENRKSYFEMYKREKYSNRISYLNQLLSELNFELPVKELVVRTYDECDRFKIDDTEPEYLNYYKFTDSLLLSLFKLVETKIENIDNPKPNILESFYVVKKVIPYLHLTQ